MREGIADSSDLGQRQGVSPKNYGPTFLQTHWYRSSIQFLSQATPAKAPS